MFNTLCQCLIITLKLRRERFNEELEGYQKQLEEFSSFSDLGEVNRYLKKAQNLTGEFCFRFQNFFTIYSLHKLSKFLYLMIKKPLKEFFTNFFFETDQDVSVEQNHRHVHWEFFLYFFLFICL